MSEDDLAAVIERYHAAARTFARGEAGPIKDLFSRAGDVIPANPFGPAVVGWPATSDRLDFVASRMH